MTSPIFKGLTELELAEAYAEECGHQYDSEDAVSEAFDSEVMPLIIEAHGVKGEAFNDSVMIAEEFNNWTDSLYKDGELHESQYNAYTYTGKYSD